MKKKALYLYKITPLLRLPASINQVFTYSSKIKFENGDLVLVDFRNRKTAGIVMGREKASKESEREKTGQRKIKGIIKIIEKKSLSRWQLKLLKRTARHYWASLALFLKIGIPQKTRASSVFEKTVAGSGSFRIDKREIQQAKTIIDKIKTKPEWLFISSDRINVYLYLISWAIKQEKQALFLVPDLFLLHAYNRLFLEVFGSGKLAVFDKNQAKGQYYKAWEDMRSGKKKIIIGTRSAVFGSFRDLGLVIIDEAHDKSFKQWDMNPRYDARWIAQRMPDYFDCPVIWGTNSPDVKDYYFFNKKQAVIRDNSPEQKILKEKAWILDAHIVDAGEKNNYAGSRVITEEVLKVTGENLAKARTIFLGTAQKGISSAYYCRDCGYIPKCPRCLVNYYSTSQGKLNCPVCNRQREFPVQCPKCRNPIIRMVGIGTERLNNELKKLFPGMPIVVINDEKKGNFRTKTEQIALTIKGGIVIGSVACLRLARFNPNTGAVIFINADKTLFIPDFTASERRFQDFSQVMSRQYQVLAQTKYPKNKAMRWALGGDFLKLNKWELKYRKIENLPPFSRLIKFIARDKDEQTAKNKLKKIFNILKRKSGGFWEKSVAYNGGIYPGYPLKKRDKFVYLLVVGLKLDAKLEAEKRKEIIETAVSEGVVIDVESEGLI